MASPKTQVLQMKYQNPDASAPLFVPVLVIANTPDEVVASNIKINSAKPLEWLKVEKEHDGVAILVGGGPSANEYTGLIRSSQEDGGTVFAMNAASQWCRDHSIDVDYQCILDAKEETVELVDPLATAHLFGSQVHPTVMDSVAAPIVWHVDIGGIEDNFPEDRKKRGGYALLGGGISVGNAMLCATYAMGYRSYQIFGYDSSHLDTESHAYSQPMNQFIPTVEVEWGGKKFISSVGMKAQAEAFQLTAKAVKAKGCRLNVYGHGLLQTIYNTPTSELSEREKYQLMWQVDAYRNVSPGEHMAEFYIKKFKPTNKVIDFGCGTGRAGIKFNDNGIDVLLIDFTDNCRDAEAQTIPFLQWDLATEIPVTAEYGYCTDVMEHIPTEDVDKVISNIMTSAEKVFFQISTVDDAMGAHIDEPLHLTVKPYEWWRSQFISNGYDIEWSDDQDLAALFYVTNPDRRETCQ